MKVLVAGATGAIGRPLVRQLVAAGHVVSGLTRSPAKMPLVSELGAIPLLADALDREWLTRVVATAAPDVVVHVLTALPPAGPTRYRDLAATNRLRRDGTANLLAAARAAGVRRLVAESIILVYGHLRTGTADEDDPVVQSAGHPALDEALSALTFLEDRVLGADDLEGIVLRYGLLYGPGTSTDHLQRALRRRMLALPAADGLMSWVHVDDAASATVTAVEDADGGAVFNVVDDEPASMEAVVRELAVVHGLRPPWRVPRAVVGVAAPYLLRALDARIPASNARIKERLGWSPAAPTYREGLRRAVQHEELDHG